MKQREIFRQLLESDGVITAPGAFDAWSAKLVEHTGFPCAYVTGYGISASLLAKPDIGLLTLTEMAQQIRNMAAAVNIPVLADGDNGYGGILNVMRTVELYEQAGVSGIQLEDQAIPKRCGHMENKEIIPKEEMVAKIKAAVQARKDPDLAIIARTDARAVNGIDDALDRAKAYSKAGADILFVEAPESLEEMRRINRELDKPTLANMVEKGKTPLLTGKELGAMGYKLVIYPVSTLFGATKAMLDLLISIRDNDTSKTAMDRMTTFDSFNEMIHLSQIRDMESAVAKSAGLS